MNDPTFWFLTFVLAVVVLLALVGLAWVDIRDRQAANEARRRMNASMRPCQWSGCPMPKPHRVSQHGGWHA